MGEGLGGSVTGDGASQAMGPRRRRGPAVMSSSRVSIAVSQPWCRRKGGSPSASLPPWGPLGEVPAGPRAPLLPLLSRWGSVLAQGRRGPCLHPFCRWELALNSDSAVQDAVRRGL